MLAAPTRLTNGSKVWLDEATREFTQRMQEYDPRLALVLNTDDSWSIWRVNEDGSEVVVARSKPNATLGPRVLARLIEGDSQRRGAKNVIEEVIKHNEAVKSQREQEDIEKEFIAIDSMLSKAWRGHVPSNVEDISI